MNRIDDLILLLLEGSISLDDKKILRSWIDKSDENRRYFKERVKVWQLAGTIGKERFHKDLAFEAFKSRIGSENEQREATARIIRLQRIYKYVACFLLLLLAGGVSFFLANGSQSNQHLELLAYVVNTPAKSKMKVDLPDGSVVWLNASSKLSYDNQFGLTNRHIELEGEAYFEIAKNKQLPLVVFSEDAEVKVLGTKFNVSNYSEDAEIQVALLEGSVEFADRRINKNVVLKPDQMVCLDKLNRNLKLKSIKAVDYNGWINNKLFFDEEPLEQIAKVLERTMGVDISFEQEGLKKQVFYGGLSVDTDNIVEVLDIMAATHGFTYKYDAKAKHVILSPK